MVKNGKTSRKDQSSLHVKWTRVRCERRKEVSELTFKHLNLKSALTFKEEREKSERLLLF